MKKNNYSILIFTLIFAAVSCDKKDDLNDDSSAITIQNLSGTYSLKALIWESAGTTVNVYAQLDVCERDNLTKLNSDKSVNFIDAGVVCSPPENGSETWDLKNDSLYVSGSKSKVQSFDGKILILTGMPPAEPGVKATTTLEKN